MRTGDGHDDLHVHIDVALRRCCYWDYGWRLAKRRWQDIVKPLRTPEHASSGSCTAWIPRLLLVALCCIFLKRPRILGSCCAGISYPPALGNVPDHGSCIPLSPTPRFPALGLTHESANGSVLALRLVRRALEAMVLNVHV